jgi:uncharacterized protein YprB with RNaseH-like and TPR domain
VLDQSLFERLKAMGVRIGMQDLAPPAIKPRIVNNLTQILPGEWRSTLYGETYVVSTIYPEDHCHGRHPLRIHTPPEIIALWAKEPLLADIPPEDYAFLDIETTGLTGSAGTYAFLIGVGRFKEGEYHLEQFFLQDLSKEAAQLAALTEFMHNSRALVTFNGKSFDIPFLQTRFIMQGMTFPFSGICHLDLLHLARKLWRERLPSRSLIDIEAKILDILRDVEDVPSWIIPQLYIDYLDTGDARFIKSVFYHNLKDVLSMVSLLNHIADLLIDPLNRPDTSAVDLFGIAKLNETLKQREAAIAVYTQSLVLGLPEDLYLQTLTNLSLLYKQMNDWKSALCLWEEAANAGQIEACIELAKYYEHHEPILEVAIEWTERADKILKQKKLARVERTRLKTMLDRRRERLLHKIMLKVKKSDKLMTEKT